VVFGGEALPGRDRHTAGARHPAHLLRRIGRHRLLEPKRVVGLDAARHADGPGGSHLPMGAEQKIGLRAHRRAQLAHEALTAIERGERRLAAVEDRIGPERIELQRREALRDIFRGPLCRQIRILIDVRAIIGPGVNVGIGAQPLMYAAAEELVDRLARGLANDVPAGHLQRAEYAHEREVRMLRVTGGVDAPPDSLDVVRIFAFQVATEHVLDQPRDLMRIEGDTVRLTDAGYTVGGRQLGEYEVTPAVVRRRITDDEGTDRLQLHE